MLRGSGCQGVKQLVNHVEIYESCSEARRYAASKIEFRAASCDVCNIATYVSVVIGTSTDELPLELLLLSGILRLVQRTTDSEECKLPANGASCRDRRRRARNSEVVSHWFATVVTGRTILANPNPTTQAIFSEVAGLGGLE